MPARKHAERAARKKQQETVEAPAGKDLVDAEVLKTEMDAILDEIDSVLVENVQEFVETYIQAGGE
jgi:ubiquitin-like protein Pup